MSEAFIAFQEIPTQLSFLALCAYINSLGLDASSDHGRANKIVNFIMLLPGFYFMSIQPDSSLTMIRLAAPCVAIFGIVINLAYFVVLKRKRELSILTTPDKEWIL